jgi:hypothetical protein
MFPNLNGHWSLFAAINLQNVNFADASETSEFATELHELPFLLHLDSAGLHSYNRIGSRIRKWLTYEWK